MIFVLISKSYGKIDLRKHSSNRALKLLIICGGNSWVNHFFSQFTNFSWEQITPIANMLVFTSMKPSQFPTVLERSNWGTKKNIVYVLPFTIIGSVGFDDFIEIKTKLILIDLFKLKIQAIENNRRNYVLENAYLMKCLVMYSGMCVWVRACFSVSSWTSWSIRGGALIRL